MDIIVTDYGNVRIGERTLRYLNAFGDWQEISRNKRRRGKKASLARLEIQEVEQAIFKLAQIAYMTGEPLVETL